MKGMRENNNREKNEGRTTTNDDALVWYACYGSNLKRERFMCYIKGGRPEGSSRVHEGCSNTRPPLDERPVEINHRLYFSKRSRTWGGGGVAFIGSERSWNEKTLGKMYLITREQFREVFAQENGSRSDGLHIDFERLVEEGEYITGNGWYGKLLFLGRDEEDKYPVFTFTASDEGSISHNPPGKKYFETIVDGLCESYPHMGREEAETYLGERIRK